MRSRSPRRIWRPPDCHVVRFAQSREFQARGDARGQVRPRVRRPGRARRRACTGLRRDGAAARHCRGARRGRGAGGVVRHGVSDGDRRRVPHGASRRADIFRDAPAHRRAARARGGRATGVRGGAVARPHPLCVQPRPHAGAVRDRGAGIRAPQGGGGGADGRSDRRADGGAAQPVDGEPEPERDEGRRRDGAAAGRRRELFESRHVHRHAADAAGGRAGDDGDGAPRQSRPAAVRGRAERERRAVPGGLPQQRPRCARDVVRAARERGEDALPGGVRLRDERAGRADAGRLGFAAQLAGRPRARHGRESAAPVLRPPRPARHAGVAARGKRMRMSAITNTHVHETEYACSQKAACIARFARLFCRRGRTPRAWGQTPKF